MYYCRCNWNGLQKDIADHLQGTHSSNVGIFKYWHYGLLSFVPEKNCVKIHLIDAFNKKFLFFYVLFADSPLVHFVVQLLGRKCDAEKYMIEFEVGAELKKIKFVEPCHSDADDLLILLNTKQTMSIPKDYFKQYANGHGDVQFQFLLKRKATVIDENRQKEEYFKSTIIPDELHRIKQSTFTKYPKPTPAPTAQKQKSYVAKYNGKMDEKSNN